MWVWIIVAVVLVVAIVGLWIATSGRLAKKKARSLPHRNPKAYGGGAGLDEQHRPQH